MKETVHINSHEETLCHQIPSENTRRQEVQFLCMYEIRASCNTTSQEVFTVETV